MELPLFPLNSVLFPGMVMQLHIFEERYKQMIRECLEKNDPFGIVLIKSGREALGRLATPHSIGTTAYITHMEPLDNGRMYIQVVGKDRFRIDRLHETKPYLMGDVELVPFEEGTYSRSNYLKDLVERYLAKLANASQLELDDYDIPESSMQLAHLAAIILQVDLKEKQHLLESNSIPELVKALIHIYRREVPLLDVLLSPPGGESPYSVN